MLWKKILTWSVIYVLSTPFSIANTGIGIEGTGDSQSFISAHSILFKHKPDLRYGSGHARLRIGSQSGIAIRSNGGIPFLATGDYLKDPVGLFLAADFGNTEVQWFNGEERDFYNLMPGGALGFFSRQGNLSIDLSVKGGYTVTNLYSHQFLDPDSYKYHGYQALVYIKNKLGFSYDKYFVRDDFSMAYSVHLKLSGSQEIIYRQEENSYDRADKRQMVLLNLEW